MTIPHTPEQNGVAERENRIIVEATRSLLNAQNNLPKLIWAEAANFAAYVLNRSGPTKIANKTPYELWFNKSTSVEHFKVIGTECFVHIPKENRRKLDKKSLRGFLVGYKDDLKGYRVYVLEKHRIIISRDVLFKNEKLSTSYVHVDNGNMIDESINTDEQNEECETEQYENDNLNISSENNCSLPELRDRTKLKRPDFFGDGVANLTERVPENYVEAVKSKNFESWNNAMNNEMNSLR